VKLYVQSPALEKQSKPRRISLRGKLKYEVCQSKCLKAEITYTETSKHTLCEQKHPNRRKKLIKSKQHSKQYVESLKGQIAF
jgi:hypothetical protein